MREEYIDPRCRVPPNTMPSENDKEEVPHALPAPAARPGKLQIDGVRILFKFTRQREREREDESGREGERETECDANLQFQNIPVKKGAPGGRRRRIGGLGGRRDLNPLASFSRPGAIVILIRLFVISPPLIRPNSPCFHNVSLSPFSFLSPSGRPLSSSFSLAQSQSH